MKKLHILGALYMMLRFICPAKAHVQLIVLWPQPSSQSGLDSIPASSFYSSLFLHYSAARTNRTTDPASVSATATTIGRRKKGEGIKNTLKKGEVRVEKVGHHIGDVSNSQVTLVKTLNRWEATAPVAGLFSAAIDPGESLTHAEAAPVVTSLFALSSLLDLCYL